LHNTCVWIDGTEGIIRSLRLARTRERVEQSAFPDIREPDNSSFQHAPRKQTADELQRARRFGWQSLALARNRFQLGFCSPLVMLRGMQDDADFDQNNFEPDEEGIEDGSSFQRNVFGGPLEPCSLDPLTGYYRDGCCNTGPDDLGQHTVCTRVTEAFLEFSKATGNDLSTPVPEYGFPGLKPGDRWCVCAMRWKQALDAGVASPVILEATHESVLKIVTLSQLQEHALLEDTDPGEKSAPNEL
jgi:uncharacterized protein (DUF2237 family)